MSSLFSSFGQVEPGTIDFSKLPVVHNPDGSLSTVRSMSFEDDNGVNVLVPTVVNGKVVSEDEAINEYYKTGRHLGKFSDYRSANRYAQLLHEREADRISGKNGGIERGKVYNSTQRLNQDELTRHLNIGQLGGGKPSYTFEPPPPLTNKINGGGITTAVAKHNVTYSSSTQEKGMVRKSNPYEAPPWEANKGISRMTDMFASSIPTLGEVAQASMMMSTPNPFSIRFGQQGANTFGHSLMQIQAMNQQRDNQLNSLLMNQQNHELQREKFAYDMHKDALDAIRDQSGKMRTTVGEAYRELMTILPKLDPASATRLMDGIVRDPIQLESLQDPTEVWNFITQKMSDAGLSWRETKKGRASGATVAPKIKSQSSIGDIVLPDGRKTRGFLRTYSDGRTEVIDGYTGGIIDAETMANAKPREKAGQTDSFAALFNGSGDTGSDSGTTEPAPQWSTDQSANFPPPEPPSVSKGAVESTSWYNPSSVVKTVEDWGSHIKDWVQNKFK